VVDQLALEYELRAKETTVPGPTNGTLAAKHVTWLNLPMRTTNMLEAAGMFTVGGLLEGFPKQLVGLTNCGPDSVKAIAKALVRCNAMTTEDAALRVQAWYAAMERR
jgi:DNA-directed RNA polymerase alpha subunit